MKYLSQATWAKLPIVDFRPRFFVETYLEKLSMYTPHFFQSRLMNVISSSREAADLISMYRVNEKNAANLRAAIEEVQSTFDHDEIAREVFSPYYSILQKFFATMGDTPLGEKWLQKLTVICRAIYSRESEYEAKLVAELRESIVGEVDLTHKKRITDRIYALTGLYTTQLLNRGYSPTYLFNRAEYFTRIQNYGQRNFSEQFDEITEKLKSRTSNYDVYYGLRVVSPQGFLETTDDPDFQFAEELPDFIKDGDLDKFRKNDTPNVIAKASVEATDYVSAAWRVKERLDKFIDAYSALDLNPRIHVLHSCIAASRNGPLTHVKVINIERLVGFLASEGGTYFKGTNTSIRRAMLALNDEGRDRLGRSLRYLRLARESISIEQKLLNLWISLESLFDARGGGILTPVMNYVPLIYAVSSIRRRAFYLRDILSANDIATTPQVKACMLSPTDRFASTTSELDIYSILGSEQAAIELFNSLGDLEHLKYKISSIHEELKINALVVKRIEKAQTDVSRQLRRIYLLRNRIAHTGHYEKIRPQLVTHLLDYIAVCYMAICASAESAKDGPVCTVGDLLLSYKMGVDVVLDFYQASPEQSNLPTIMTKPVI